MSKEEKFDFTNKQENYNLTWEQVFHETFDTLKWQIQQYLKQLNLSNITLDEVRNEIFLILTKLIKLGRIEYKIIDNNFVFINIKRDQPKEPIENFKAWLRTVIFNHLKKLRKAQNKIDKILNIDNFSHYHSREKYFSYIDKNELLEKLKSLGDEDRRIIEMFYFQRLNYQEIAASLQSEGFPKCSNANLRKKKGRALEKLRNLYGK